MMRKYSWPTAVPCIAGTLLWLFFATEAPAGVLDDIKNFISELVKLPGLVDQVCQDAVNALSTDVDNATLMLVNEAATERGLVAAAAADAVKTVAEAERLEVAGTVVLTAETKKLMVDTAAQANQLSQDSGIALAQLSDTVAACRRATRQGCEAGRLAVKVAILDNRLVPLRDYLLDLATHPWDFSLSDVEVQLTAIDQDVKGNNAANKERRLPGRAK